jgi:ribosomal protein S30
MATPVAPPAAPASLAEEPRFALATPPANESWWRNPIVVAGAVVTLFVGGGSAATWRFLAGSGAGKAVLAHHVSSVPSVPPTTPMPPPTPVPEPAAIETSVHDVDRLLVRSQAGRIAALQRRDYAAALRNRRAILRSLDALDAPAGATQLAAAYATLREAMEASATADAQHLSCGCDALQPGDVRAQGLKRQFARLFSPFAQRYLDHTVDANSI